MLDFVATESVAINELDSKEEFKGFSKSIADGPISLYADSPLLSDRSHIPRGILGTLQVSEYHSRKRFWEVPLALLLCIPALIMTGILILLVRLTSKGPGIYSQVRTGLGGKTFKMHKIRSMFIDAESYGAQWCSGDKDPRMTHLGRWLRKLHLDELPQIINVLRGEMSFCGPRPERPEFVEKLDHCVPYYYSRLVVRPGITGFSQINLPPDTCIKSVMRKQTLDLEYIETGRIVSDFRMILCTALRLVGVPGTLATRMSGLEMTPDESRFSLIYAPLWEEVELNAPRAADASRTLELVG